MVKDNRAYNQLGKLQQVLLKQQIPFASYRLPLENQIITLVQHHSLPEKLESLDNLESKVGFIISPFIESTQQASYFLKPDCVFFSNEIDNIYIQKLAENKRFVDEKKTVNTAVTTTIEEYIGNVNKAVEALKNTDFQKVVVSKVRVEKLQPDFGAENQPTN